MPRKITPQRLSLHHYWQAIGTDRMKQVVEIAGTSWAYYQLMAYYVKPCSPATFAKIRKAARIVTPGIEPDFETCCDTEIFQAIRAERRQLARAGLRQPPLTNRTGRLYTPDGRRVRDRLEMPEGLPLLRIKQQAA